MLWMLWKLALRDGVLLTVAALLVLRLAPLSGGTGMGADLTGVVAGLAIGLATFVLHEWGHLLGALAGRSRVRLPERLGSIYLFSYDSKRNSRPRLDIPEGVVTWGVIGPRSARFFVLSVRAALVRNSMPGDARRIENP